MSRANKLGHYENNAHFGEVCEDHDSLETHDSVPIRKIVIANIDPETPYKLLVNTFKKFGTVVDCILKKQREYDDIDEGNQNQEDEEENSETPRAHNSKSYAFLTYSTAEEAQRAIQAGIRREISIKKLYLRVTPANTWNQPDSRDYRNKTRFVCEHKASTINLDAEVRPHAYFRIEDDAPINKLNNDCLRKIFNHLPLYDRVRVERVSQRWKLVSEEAWHDMRKLDFNPMNWGAKSTRELWHVTSPDGCSVYNILKKCCPYVTHIDLSEFSNQLGNSTLIKLANMCTLIESINLKNFNFSHSGIKALATHCRSLKSIRIGYTESAHKFDGELSVLFSLNKRLQHIDIDCFIIEGYCLNHLPKNSMQEITLRNANYVIKSGLYKIFQKCPNLRVIKIIGIPAAFGQYLNFVESVCSCSKLEVLEIPTKRRAALRYMNLHFLNPLADLKNLTTINLKGNCTVGDEFLILLSEKCRNLTRVDISHCPNVRDHGLDSVTSLPNLEYLCIDALCTITDGVFLKRMPNIKTLLCSGSINLRCFGFSMFLEYANKLEILDLSNCRFISNDLVIDAIRRCKRTKWRCLKMYLRGTNARLAGINLRFHWKYLQLFDENRPEDNSFLIIDQCHINP